MEQLKIGCLYKINNNLSSLIICYPFDVNKNTDLALLKQEVFIQNGEMIILLEKLNTILFNNENLNYVKLLYKNKVCYFSGTLSFLEVIN